MRADVTMGQRLLTIPEAAKMLACTEAAIRKWCWQGRLKPVKLGRLVRLRLRDIEALIDQGLATVDRHAS